MGSPNGEVVGTDSPCTAFSFIRVICLRAVSPSLRCAIRGQNLLHNSGSGSTAAPAVITGASPMNLLELKRKSAGGPRDCTESRARKANHPSRLRGKGGP
jgi:hypothetical protein